ncbi:hypothetical protein LVJ94_00205 [Pendulispora rubella]|uniref:Uncharacterized protein n=1 Tax=Pendulispora rubella TaxID=2741070 RepID=A0ABZ2L799_9BACT
MSDPLANEHFVRIVGRRQRPPVGTPPTIEARQAMAEMAKYSTRAPKGVFIYPSHEAANADRESWLIEAMRARALASGEP